MAKKIMAVVKLQVQAGAANPAPPVGTALGPHGVNIMDFCKQFNAKTQQQTGMVIPAVITIYADRTFTFITKTPPAPNLLLKEAGLDLGVLFNRSPGFFYDLGAASNASRDCGFGDP